ncbi:hypothetical protein B0T25DRAFT_546025 [Lasiosphaeria hispida]|uniref:Uncharacterized protein n=1 Tax=Lasiosphaeria hispida TaxID=260671 RepID=A0AAJ0HD26_9PEZI|nr:hypothetical protein B0T25DRAFT_546025 [Lasiosphaeria hispida]
MRRLKSKQPTCFLRPRRVPGPEPAALESQQTRADHNPGPPAIPNATRSWCGRVSCDGGGVFPLTHCDLRRLWRLTGEPTRTETPTAKDGGHPDNANTQLPAVLVGHCSGETCLSEHDSAAHQSPEIYSWSPQLVCRYWSRLWAALAGTPFKPLRLVPPWAFRILPTDREDALSHTCTAGWHRYWHLLVFVEDPLFGSSAPEG